MAGKQFVVSVVTEDFATTVEVGENIEAGIKVGKCFKTLGSDYLELDFFWDGILLPDPWEDGTFFYATLNAAKQGRVWLEEGHRFVTRSFKDSFEAGCFSEEDLNDGEYSWEEQLTNSIYEDIFGYTPVTGEDGYALVHDPDVAKICELYNWDVVRLNDDTWRVAQKILPKFPDEEIKAEAERFRRFLAWWETNGAEGDIEQNYLLWRQCFDEDAPCVEEFNS